MGQLCKLWPRMEWIIKNLKLYIDRAVLNNSLLYTQVYARLSFLKMYVY